jgi:cytoskeleton protein RodZ
MSDAAQPFGQRLKAERERRGMSTQKVADEMHLDAWVIDALEAGDYQRIGPSVYAKGHLKKYASMLGVSAAETAAGYDHRSAEPMTAVAPPPGMRMRSAAPSASNLPWPQIAGFVVIALVVGGIFWWRPWHQRSGMPAPAALAGPPASGASEGAARPAATSPSVEHAGQSPPEPETATFASNEPAVEAGTAAGAAENAAGSAAASPTPATGAAIPAMLAKSAGTGSEVDSTLGAGRAHLRLSFSADSWVDVHDADGRQVFAGNGRANSVKTIAGAAPLRVYLGFASGVQLEVTDRAVAIGPQFVTGDVARFEAGADGVLRRDSRAIPTNGEQTHAAPPRG